MPTILPTKSIYYNDVTLVSTKPGKLESRRFVPNELYRCICSPMPSIVGKTFTEEASKNGISLTIPRFISIEKKVELYNLFEKNRINKKQLCFIGLSLNEQIDDLDYIYNRTECNSWLIDIAFSGIPQLEKSVKSLFYSRGSYIENLMLGNFSSGEEFRRLNKIYKQYCNNLLGRCGISNGANCSTSDATGFGRGQITELMECNSVKEELNQDDLFLVADSGIKHSGFASRAFGCGADYVLMGRYWVNSLEAETNVIGEHLYWGLASYEQIKRSNLDKLHSEGKVTKVNANDLKPLKVLSQELWGGLSSAVSFSGYSTLSEFIGNAILEIKENSLPPKGRY